MPTDILFLSTTDLKKLKKNQTVFFFSVGPIEDHGPHLPLGIDGIEAKEYSKMAAELLEKTLPEWKGVLLPWVPLGVDSNTTRYALCVRPHVLRDYLVDICLGLIKMGFQHFVFFAGHLGPKQLSTLEDAAQLIKRRLFWKKMLLKCTGNSSHFSVFSAQSYGISFKETLKSPFWPDPLEHAGSRDTSIGLQLCPTHVRQEHTQLPSQERHPCRWVRNFKRRRKTLEGYWGSPALSDPIKGKEILEKSIQNVFPIMLEIWQGKKPDRKFRSWYSIFPMNRSFFKAWLLAFWICLVLIGVGLLQGAFLFSPHPL